MATDNPFLKKSARGNIKKFNCITWERQRDSHMKILFSLVLSVPLLDEKKYVHVVCKISKAFDKVWHKGLLFKLQKIGISGAMPAWIAS